MRYQVVVFKLAARGDLREAFIDREFDFSESAHKITDVINAAVDQLETEGGPGPSR